MSRSELNNLCSFLLATLSTEDKKFLVTRLQEESPNEESLTLYTTDELYQMVADGEKQIAEGRCYSTEEVIRMCNSDLAEAV